MAAKDKNGPGNNKAYMPVPKGYKGNWNVPKGTPWKKDSPYNPANSPSAKKAAEAKSQRDAVAARKAANAKASANKVAASYKSSDDKMMTMAKQGRAVTVAKAKQMASPTSRVTKKPAGYKPAVAPKGITPSDRRGSMDNIKRAAQTNRANKAASAKASASRTSKSVVTGAANKMRRFS